MSSTGPVVSATVIRNDPDVEPAALVAVHVTVVLPSGNVDPEAGVHETEVASSAVTSSAKCTTAPAALVASTNLSPGTVSSGGPPVTRTKKDSVVRLKCASRAVQRTCVLPEGNVEPDAGEQVTGTEPSMLSTALAVKVTTGLSVSMSPGTVTTGGVVSVTNTAKPPAVVPPASVAEHCTMDVPIGNSDPDCGSHVTGTGEPSLAATAVASNVTFVPRTLSASTVTNSGRASSGGPDPGCVSTVNDAGPWTRVPVSSYDRTSRVCAPAKAVTSIGTNTVSSVLVAAAGSTS